MSIEVNREVIDRIRGHPGGFVIQVECDPSDSHARQALEAAAYEIANLRASARDAEGYEARPKFVSGVAPTPIGFVFAVDGGHVPEDLLLTIPDIIHRHLRENDVVSALISTPDDGGPLADLEKVQRAAILYLYPSPKPWTAVGPKPALPASWTDQACGWLTGRSDPADPQLVKTIVEFAATAGEVRSTLEMCRSAGSATLVTGHPSSRIRALQASFIGFQRLALGAGGPTTSDDELIAEMGALIRLAEELVPSPAYAYLTVDPNFARFQVFDHSTELQAYGGPSPELVRDLCDELVLDGYPYQLLGPGHFRRLRIASSSSAAASALEVARPLSDGRVAVPIGALEDWLIDRAPSTPWWWLGLGSHRRDPTIQDRAREILAPCLLSPSEADRLWIQKRSEAG